jgi:signal transduction histidine kinase
MLADNERLLGTVEQVLQASSTREKQRLMNLAEIDLRALIGDTIKTVREQRHLDDAAIRFSEAADGINVLGDRRELQTVITNLLDNAVKYSVGEPKISVKLKSSSPARAEIYIRDKGIGLSRGDLKRVFKRFYRVPNKSIDGAKGTGLGLAIVSAIIEKHGGRVRAESKGEGKGTTFYIQLPRV